MRLGLVLLLFVFCISAQARWFWEKSGELKCVPGLNGENCYWQEAVNSEEERKLEELMYTPVQIRGYVLMRPITTDETVNRIYVDLLQILENLSVMRELEDSSSARTGYDKVFLNIIAHSINFLNLTPNVPKQYWTSRGPKYISAWQAEAKKARCLQNYFRTALEDQFPDRIVERGVIDCGFVEAR